MLAEWKKKWVDALRSGKYQQAEGVLLNEKTGAMCCLGVLREIVQPGNRESEGNTGGMITEALAALVGLGSVRDWVEETTINHPCYYSEMNDAGVTFPNIADEIEKNL